MRPEDRAAVAAQRHHANRFSPTNTPLYAGADDAGVAGEAALARLLGLAHTPDAGGPNRGWQFEVTGVRIKVQTSPNPGNLLIPAVAGKLRADVYVLGAYEPRTRAVTFLGWATREQIAAAPVRLVRRDGIPSHAIPVRQLNPLSTLTDRLERGLAPLPVEPRPATLQLGLGLHAGRDWTK